ncbi:MAG: response regulator, partial [Chitinispirillaceae bacterium]|nr:response regulator [Chitinispirillaceae bacterium]
MLQNVILNLGINARDACEGKEDGVISYFTNSIYLEEGNVLCKSFSIKEGKYIEIRVSDNGCGIKKEIIDRIFEPFFSTKPKEKGTGLGLANVWRYIETFKGAIRVESEEGVGSTFFLYLPVITQNIPIETKEEIVKLQKERMSEPLPKEVTTSPDIPKKIILIADDEESFRNIYSTILSEYGYIVYTCKDGLEAVNFVKSSNFPIDLIILDVIMPNLNGPQAMEEIRKYIPEVKILFTSGFSNDNILKPLLSSPNTAFLLKPIEEEKLLNFISSFLSQ